MIKFTYKYLKPVALFLAVAVLFQCCKIYDKKPVSIDQAINKSQIKIITTDGHTWKFDDIYYKDDSLLYGITRIKSHRNIETKIPKEQIKDQLYKTGPNGTTETFITVDGKKHKFDSYYFENDTLFGISSISKNENNEILIPIENIKEIYLHNHKKSNTGNSFIVVGVVVVAGLIMFGVLIWAFLHPN